MTKVYLITLGCPKNLVDSEIMLGLIKKSGIKISKKSESADIICINTCAFIQEAKQEAIDTILELAKLKQKDPRKKIIVIGCLVQRYLKELQKQLPEVDYWVTLNEIPKISSIIKNITGTPKNNYTTPSPSSFLYDASMPRYLITPKHYAYIKIAEGCSNLCSYCAVTNIKGRYKSRLPDSILNEAKNLVKKGVKEIIIIAQDITNYGIDLASTANLTELLRQLCKISGIKWIRLMYLHPAHITDGLIKEIAINKKICKYIDLPLQHIDDDILLKMGRKAGSNHIKNLIKKIRKEIPGVILRTSFIVGFPGETEEKFQTLLKFIRQTKFERLGVFKYSREEGTPAYKMPNQVPEKIKEKRFHEAMQLQNSIAKEANKRFFGKTIDVLIDHLHKKSRNIWIGRTHADSPDIDGVVYIDGKNIKKGDIISVRITGTLDYDLIGKAV